MYGRVFLDGSDGRCGFVWGGGYKLIELCGSKTHFVNTSSSWEIVISAYSCFLQLCALSCCWFPCPSPRSALKTIIFVSRIYSFKNGYLIKPLFVDPDCSCGLEGPLKQWSQPPDVIWEKGTILKSMAHIGHIFIHIFRSAAARPPIKKKVYF